MMIKHYKFEMKGTGNDGNTWTTMGSLNCDFNDAFKFAMRSTFHQLTQGKAIYGKPGVGCKGPYDILSVIIEQVKQ